MKVFIGNYPARLICRVHSRIMNRRYGYTWPEYQTKFEGYIEKLDNIIQVVYNVANIAWFDKRTQKVNVRIDRWDSYSMDTTLAHIVVPMLKAVKADKHGAPYVENVDVPEHLRSTIDDIKNQVNSVDQLDDRFFKRWDWVLEEMLFAFQCKLVDYESKFYSGESDIYFEKIPGSSNSIMKTGSKHTFEVDRKGLGVYEARIQNGFRLFGKYYNTLWT